MSLSYDLISQFAKITNDTKKVKKEVTTYGTIVKYNNANYVKIDGSDLLTPYSTTAAVKDGDRVIVSVKNHTVTVGGSTSNPSASNLELQETNLKVDKFGKIIADKIEVEDLEVINGYFEQILAITGKYEDLNAVTARIEKLQSDYADMEYINADDVEIINAEIDNLKALILESTLITAQDLESVNAEFGNLTVYNAHFTYLSAEKLKAVNAEIHNLDVDKLDADEAELKYVNIDFGNINVAWLGQFFSESGIIQNVQTEHGYVSGELFGVTINGDLINVNTLKADRLVILGEDGIYYKLNIDGLNNISTTQSSKFDLLESKPEDWEMNYKDYYLIINNVYTHLVSNEAPTWQSDTYYKLNSTHESGLDGTNIIAHTITADKITVSDLVAFGATIGGFHITNNSIYSGVKNSVNNTTRGIYLDNTGQVAIGDSNNFVKYYFDELSNTYKLVITAGSIKMAVSNKTLEEEIEDLKDNVATNLKIESSRGTVFKNNQASTVLSVVIYRGADRITNINDLHSIVGNDAYLQWYWRRINDSSYGVISSSDSHISNNGFTYTLNPSDVDNQVTYKCELIKN